MQNSPQKINPLIGMMRQPKIYIKLPSNGNYWSDGSLQLSPNGEYPVYSMTAKDELILKTPDALLNGQAVVDVIQSCLPNIINAWECPQIDVDLILVEPEIVREKQLSYSNILKRLWDNKIDYRMEGYEQQLSKTA